MDSRRAHTARIGIVALAAVAFLLAFAIPTSNRTAGVPAGARSVGLQADIGGLPILSGQVLPAANSGSLNPKSPIQNPKLVESYGRLPLAFEANRGQTDGQVKFLSRGRGYTMFLTQGEAVLSLRKPSAVSRQPSAIRNSKFENRNSTTTNLQSEIFNLPSLLPRPTDYGPRTTGEQARHSSLVTRHSDAVVRMKLVGANPRARVTGLDPLPGRSNYFLGNDPKKWRTNVPNYARVKYEGVYAGIDLLYYGNQGRLEYDFVVSPGANPKAITLEIDGAVRAQGLAPLRVDGGGDLVIGTEAGEIRLHKPVVYQPNPESRTPNPGFSTTDNGPRTTANHQSSIDNRQFLDGRFLLLASNRIGFEVPNYDKSLPLVIDPVLSYSTYLGGTGWEGGNSGVSVAVDSTGCAYITGATDSVDFPMQNPLQGTFPGYPIGFITKLNPEGTALVYSTYLEGGGMGIAVDASGNAYVAGFTGSSDFPTTAGAFQRTYAGGGDTVVLKLDPTGSELVYSTYLGGSGNDLTQSNYPEALIAVDPSGNAYVTGWTFSTDFPTTPGALKTALVVATCGVEPYTMQCPDAFVAKLNSSGSDLIYSTYLGGDDTDGGVAIAADASGNAYVTGVTSSTNFPTLNPIQGAFGGGTAWWGGDAFVTKFNPDGTLAYSTYLGGSMDEFSMGIAVDSSGSAYVTGTTLSADFPTRNALQPTFNSYYGCKAFIAKITPGGFDLAYSTYFGGGYVDGAMAIAVDMSGSAHVTGMTISPDFPTVNPIQPVRSGGTCGGGGAHWLDCYDSYVAKLNADGSALVFSTFLGGTGYDWGGGIAVDPSGNVYAVGWTNSTDFPVSAGAFQTAYNASPDSELVIIEDVFVTKIGPADNTPAGSSVDVHLTKAVSLTFDSVSTSGTTGVTRTEYGPGRPAGFNLGDPPAYYRLRTTAVFSGSVMVCMNYGDISFDDESQLKLFHYEDGAWVDRTISLDTANKIICASVISLSPFAVLEDRRIEAEGLKPPLADLAPEGLPVAMPGNAFKQGRTLPLRLGLSRDGVALSNADVSPPQIVALIRNGEALDLATMDLDAGQANDNGTLFRFSDGNWVYNLSTQGLSAGTYTITIQMPDGRRWNAGFVLR
jgi:hypothetical protein